jgi:acyl-CoA thioesterase FadM
VAFKRPILVGEELVVTGEVLRDRGRGIETRGMVTRAADSELLAEATALFLRMPDERRAELERRYSRTDEAFARVRGAVEAEAQQKEHVRT